MKKNFIMPDIGEGIVECEVMDWLVAEGDPIQEDQAICEVMTDKALVQIPATDHGTISKLYVAKGEIARVGEPLFEIEVAGDSADAQENVTKEAESSTDSSQVPEAETPTPPATSAQTTNKPASSATQEPERLQLSKQTDERINKAVASPSVRRIARENNVDLSQVDGSGERGRIYKEDVEAYLSKNTQQAPDNTETMQRIEPITGIRAAMARQMTASLAIPRFGFSEEFCLDKLLALRQQLKVKFEERNNRLTLLPFFIKALSLALKDYPIIGARFSEDEKHLIYPEGHHIGIAMDTDIGLVVPVIRDCDKKSLFQIAHDLQVLINDAKNTRLTQKQFQGACVSISNIGTIGATVASPVVNPPQLAIVALGRLQKLPRFDENDQVVAQHIMTVSWSADHRVIDGATIVRFNKLWQEYLEHPEQMLIDLI